METVAFVEDLVGGLGEFREGFGRYLLHFADRSQLLRHRTTPQQTVDPRHCPPAIYTSTSCKTSHHVRNATRCRPSPGMPSAPLSWPGPTFAERNRVPRPANRSFKKSEISHSYARFHDVPLSLPISMSSLRFHSKRPGPVNPTERPNTAHSVSSIPNADPDS